MRKFIAILIAVAACGCLITSCNEKPKNYHFVKVLHDGTEQVQDITATNDTDALKQYLNTMERIVIENIDKPEAQQYKAMFVISPDGDTLNTNDELLESVMKGQPGVVNMQPSAATPAADDPARDMLPPTSVPADH